MHHTVPHPPPFGTFQPQLSSLPLPAVHPRSAHVVTLDPHGASALPLVAQPSTIDTACTPNPRAGHHPAWPYCPCWPRRPFFAQALRERRSPASCWNVTLHPMEPRCAHRLAPAKPNPHRCFLFYCPGAGGWGPWGLQSSCSRTCRGERVPGAGPEPVTRPHPRAWGITQQRASDPGGGLPGTMVEVEEYRWESCRGHSGEASRELAGHGSDPHTCYPPGALPRAVINCTPIEGAKYSACGPPCPRSCDDLMVSLGS